MGPRSVGLVIATYAKSVISKVGARGVVIFVGVLVLLSLIIPAVAGLL